MAQPKKPPMRHCTGCGAELPKSEMIRIVRAPDGTVSIDEKGKSSGRGAYVCRKASCVTKAAKTGRLGRSLGVQIPAEVYENLAAQIGEND